MSVIRIARAALILCCFAFGTAWAGMGLFSSSAEPEFLDAKEVFTLNEVQRDGSDYVVQGHVADGYYVYRHSLKLGDAQGQEVPLTLAAGAPKHDEFFGDTEIYQDDAASLRFPAKAAGPLTLHWQGCAEAGICYPPQTMRIDGDRLDSAKAVESAGTADPSKTSASTGMSVGTTEQADEQANASPGQTNDAKQYGATAPVVTDGVADDQATADRLAALGPITAMLLFLGFGLLLAFTPCSLPMIPIISAMIVGSQARPRRASALSLSYVLTMAATYAVVGVAAGLVGANLQATLQSPWLLGAFAALFLVLASSLFGLFELQLPTALMNRIQSAGQNRPGGSVAGAAGLGFLSALLVGPCMTAPLAGVLLYISQTGSALQGGLALFALGLGMGLPLLVIAIFGAEVLPRPGAWMDRVRITFGYVMVGMAIMMLDRFLPGTISLVLWGAWILSMTVGLIAWSQAVAAKHRLAWTLRSVAAFAGLWSVLMLVGAASGAESAWQPLAHLRGAAAAPATVSQPNYVAAKSVDDLQARLNDAASHQKWTLIDFYADWCISCHVIEKNVFGDPAVAARLAQLQVVRPDVTQNDPTDQELLRHWGVMGPPTMILVGPDGKERRDLRMVGEVKSREFLARLDAAEAS